MARLAHYRIGLIGAGALAGVLICLLLELSGHRWWFILMMFAGVMVTALAASVAAVLLGRRTRFLRFRLLLPLWTKVLIVAVLIGITLAALNVADINPRDYSYLPLLFPVILTCALFGFGQGLLSVILCTAVADYLFALPEYDFMVTEWEDALGLAFFGILGAGFAWCIDEILRIGEQ